jgi:hypothetical protein
MPYATRRGCEIWRSSRCSLRSGWRPTVSPSDGLDRGVRKGRRLSTSLSAGRRPPTEEDRGAASAKTFSARTIHLKALKTSLRWWVRWGASSRTSVKYGATKAHSSTETSLRVRLGAGAEVYAHPRQRRRDAELPEFGVLLEPPHLVHGPKVHLSFAAAGVVLQSA